MLACPLHGVETTVSGDSMTAMMTEHIQKGIIHLKEYFGLELTLKEIRILPALNALCADAGNE